VAVKLGIQLLHRRLLAAFFSLSTRSGIAAVPNRSHASSLIPARFAAHTIVFGYKAGQLQGLAAKLLMVGSLRKGLKALWFRLSLSLLGLCLSIKALKLWATHS
jgi:hypothetical protein